MAIGTIDDSQRTTDTVGGTNSSYNPGRVAGFFYLLIVVFGPVRLIYIPNKLFVHGNASATVANIAAHERLFRFGIVADLVCGVTLIFLVLAFYRLFKGVDQNLAVLVGIFGGVMPALVYFVGVVSDAAALIVVRGGGYLSAFDTPQRDALAMLFLNLRDQQNTAAEMLWGVWLFPLALLGYRSRFLPRFLGVWLGIGGFAYVILSLTGELLPQYEGTVFTYAQPAFFGELAIMLWLVVKGPPTRRRARASGNRRDALAHPPAASFPTAKVGRRPAIEDAHRRRAVVIPKRSALCRRGAG